MTMPRRAAWPPVLRNSYLAALPARGADSRGVLHPCEDKEKAKKYIADLIAPFNAVDTWLYQKDIPDEYLTSDNMLEYRKRWIDHMIKELEKEGK